LELVKSEETYVSGLNVLIQKIKNPLLSLSYTKKALISTEGTIVSLLNLKF
jgi:hypothetical protein